jgi:putative transposase
MPGAGRVAGDDLPPPKAQSAPVTSAAGARARALSEEEREAALAELHGERFVDCSPAQVWATVLDEGRIWPGSARC